MKAELRKVAVDALYNAREADKVMDTAAEAVATAVCEELAAEFFSQPERVRTGRETGMAIERFLREPE